ncbi:hypothetical protein VA603_08740 [Stenotrophomonas sp. MH1]|jgi:hypothetical protein|uniref:Lipoprotein n=1 Tax=Stenotrophomonas capsici TaxID=3110230 RepID=A0ABU5V441_9GAMM|nr:hypothetical protein [Stenotrophomonas sp. MH1]MEA5667613.1 hypothetical protein [Stenotrophomonas sp. MH1]
MKKTSLSSALMIAVIGAVALVGCKKKEEEAAPPPAASTPAPAPAPMAEPAAPALSVTSVTVGNTVAADQSVAPVAMLGTKDKIVVSVKTSGTANNVTVGAKLTYQDGQVAGEQSATLNATDTGTTNVEFTKPSGWPAGKYTADVTVDGKSAGSQQFEVK